MAFSQMLVTATSLARRFEESKTVRIVEKEVARPVVIRVPAPAARNEAGNERSAETTADNRPAPPQQSFTLPPPASPSLPPAPPLAAPRIADPRSERLVNEARECRVAGDMGAAVLKLEEALSQSPDDAVVRYEMGVVHEIMGVYDRATDHYQAVFAMGIQRAGPLYALAASKIRDGFRQSSQTTGKLSLGKTRVFRDPDRSGSRRTVLTIPVQKAPGASIDNEGISISVLIFNKNRQGDIVQLEDGSWVTQDWTSLPFDWTLGEETLRMTYTIPPNDDSLDLRFSDLSYYGHVVTLSYQGETIDMQAEPRHLAAKITGAGEAAAPYSDERLPPDFDPDLPLLPALPAE
jgi:hypothetical protein